MNTFIEERHKHSESCIRVKVSRRTQKTETDLANEGFGPAFFSEDLEHVFGSNFGNEFGVIIKGKGPHKPEFAHDIVHIHSLMIYTDLIGYNITGDTNTPLLRCYLFISKLKAGNIISTGQCMNNHTFSNCNSDHCSKNVFIVITLTWQTRAVKKYLLYLSASLVLFRCLEKPIIKTLQDGCFKTKKDSIL